MPYKLYAEPGSQPSRSVNYTFLKLGIEREYVETLVFTGTGTEEFKQINPNHQVPVIDHDGFILRESVAIIQYLCDNNEGGEKLLPRDDPQKRAMVFQWLLWNTGNGRPAFVEPIRQLRLFPMFFGAPKATPEEEKKLLDGAYEQIQIMEDQLNTTEWLAGDEFTVADSHIYQEIQTMTYMLDVVDLSPYPKVLAWLAKLEEDELIVRMKDEAAASMGPRMSQMES